MLEVNRYESISLFTQVCTGVHIREKRNSQDGDDRQRKMDIPHGSIDIYRYI